MYDPHLPINGLDYTQGSSLGMRLLLASCMDVVNFLLLLRMHWVLKRKISWWGASAKDAQVSSRRLKTSFVEAQEEF